jgi:hypothetical protein
VQFSRHFVGANIDEISRRGGLFPVFPGLRGKIAGNLPEKYVPHAREMFFVIAIERMTNGD